MPATFHGGPFHGVTVDVDLPEGFHEPHSGWEGAYRVDGGALLWGSSAPPVAEVRPAQLADHQETVHVRPAEPDDVKTRPKRRQVTRR